MSKVKRDIILEYTGNKLLSENEGARILIQDMYSNSSDNNHPLCPSCFANQPESPQCRYLLEGIDKIW